LRKTGIVAMLSRDFAYEQEILLLSGRFKERFNGYCWWRAVEISGRLAMKLSTATLLDGDGMVE